MLCIQWNFNTWNSLDLVGIHSSSAKCIIQIIDSFASTYQPMYNSSNTPSCCKSLSLQHMPFFSTWNSLISVYLSITAGSLCLPSHLHQAFCDTPASFWWCIMNGFAVACKHAKNSLYLRILYMLPDLFASSTRLLWSPRSERVSHKIHSHLH